MDFGSNQAYIVGLLSKRKQIDAAQLDAARKLATQESIGIVDALVRSETLPEALILKMVADDLGMEFLDLTPDQIEGGVLTKLPYARARDDHIMPVRMDFETLIVATHRPLDLDFLDNLRVVLSRPVDAVVATYEGIRQCLSLYGQDAGTGGKATVTEDGKPADDDLLNYMEDAGRTDRDDAPVIRLVSLIITDAYRMHASDIHLEPMESYLRVRFRIDGVLHEMKRHPKALQPSILSRVKLLAHMELSEKRLPQDGKIKIKIKGHDVDIRVSSLPSQYGESIVMRLLDKQELAMGVVSLGFLSDTEKIWNELIHLPNGVLLITGPTGSGKTTTLYACLNVLNKPGLKIITVEDPVEYQLTGINQVQVREEIDLTFSSVLRACLRQAPNIIMVGEIRDSETAHIAMNAAFTGHLVFSTLHTNDAAGAVTRLIDQGIKPFLVASAVRAVLAQRLVRKICRHCKVEYPATEEELDALRLQNTGQKVMLSKGEGCTECGHSGYRGRVGIFELLVMTPEVMELVYQVRSSAEIREHCIQKGMRSLREDGLLKVLNGTTTVEELLRVTKIGEE